MVFWRGFESQYLCSVNRLGLMLYNIRPSVWTLARVHDIYFWKIGAVLSRNCLMPAESRKRSTSEMMWSHHFGKGKCGPVIDAEIAKMGPTCRPCSLYLHLHLHLSIYLSIYLFMLWSYYLGQVSFFVCFYGGFKRYWTFNCHLVFRPDIRQFCKLFFSQKLCSKIVFWFPCFEIKFENICFFFCALLKHSKIRLWNCCGSCCQKRLLNPKNDNFIFGFAAVRVPKRPFLVAPYRAIPRDYLSDTPLLRAMGVLVSQHGQWGAIPPPPFLSVSPLESIREVEVRYPPHKRGISAILARYPIKTRQKRAIPPSAILSRKGIARYGGVSRTGPLSGRFVTVIWFL